ncbi:MAG TPA: hypothetical protein VMZ90_06070 [Vicinamibacterales bacterium]|nr:hypothetical protein [Vicinamibacterales bacterium]
MKEFTIAIAAGLLVEIVGAILTTHRRVWVHVGAVGAVILALIIVTSTEDQQAPAASQPAESPLSAPPPPSAPPTSADEIATIPFGYSESFFDGDVLINVIGTSIGGTPARVQVNATVAGPGRKSLRLSDMDVGDSVVFDETYQIRLLEIEVATRFSVHRLAKPRKDSSSAISH